MFSPDESGKNGWMAPPRPITGGNGKGEKATIRHWSRDVSNFNNNNILIFFTPFLVYHVQSKCFAMLWHDAVQARSWKMVVLYFLCKYISKDMSRLNDNYSPCSLAPRFAPRIGGYVL